MSKPEKENKKWLAYIDGHEIYLDNISYLNLLMKRSEEAIRLFKYTDMVFVMYDLEEIREKNNLFYSLYKILIDCEISTLKRLSLNGVESMESLKRERLIKHLKASSSNSSNT